MRNLQQGDRLRAIYTIDSSGPMDQARAGADCDEIIVVMESGSAAWVPWAAVFKGGKEIRRYNLALCLGVEVADDQR